LLDTVLLPDLLHSSSSRQVADLEVHALTATSKACGQKKTPGRAGEIAAIAVSMDIVQT
jgi:hypothetical protein